MNKYELLLVLPGTLDDKQVDEKVVEIAAMVKEHASDVETQTIGKNRLAYPIKQIRYGYFFTITFSAEPMGVKKLEEKLRIHREVLRFLVSHFNTQLTALQKTAYSTEQNNAVPVVEKEVVFAPNKPHSPAETVAAVEKDTVKPARKAEPLDLGAINKKLDDLMSGDVVPGV
jgi:small subunit ribosomal protein S6